MNHVTLCSILTVKTVANHWMNGDQQQNVYHFGTSKELQLVSPRISFNCSVNCPWSSAKMSSKATSSRRRRPDPWSWPSEVGRNWIPNGQNLENMSCFKPKIEHLWTSHLSLPSRSRYSTPPVYLAAGTNPRYNHRAPWRLVWMFRCWLPCFDQKA